MRYNDRVRQEEIESMVEALRKTWKRNPYMRLGQLVVNATPTGQDTFYVDDETMTKALDVYPRKVD